MNTEQFIVMMWRGVACVPRGLDGLATAMCVQGFDVIPEVLGIPVYAMTELVKIGGDRRRNVNAEKTWYRSIFHRFKPGSENVSFGHELELLVRVAWWLEEWTYEGKSGLA
jgi:hypothetical protein